MIGIIGAMEVEIEKLREQMENVVAGTRGGMTFFQGTLLGQPVVLVRSGIGKVNAAACTQILFDCYGVELVMNTGIAGSLRNEINIGDIVVATDALQHDVEAVAFGYAPGVIPQMECSAFPADEKLRELAVLVCREALPDIGIHCGRVLSGDQFIASREKKEQLVELFSGYCTEMEGAAIAQVAYLNKVPYMIIRAISDKADDSAQMDYGEFERQAIDHMVKLVTGMLQRFRVAKKRDFPDVRMEV